jgi:hypothetical protein
LGNQTSLLFFFSLLSFQEDEPEEDTWNVAMAAGTCLSLIAGTAGDDVIPYVMPFVQENINHAEWKNREAATLAFGSKPFTLFPPPLFSVSSSDFFVLVCGFFCLFRFSRFRS